MLEKPAPQWVVPVQEHCQKPPEFKILPGSIFQLDKLQIIKKRFNNDRTIIDPQPFIMRNLVKYNLTNSKDSHIPMWCTLTIFKLVIKFMLNHNYDHFPIQQQALIVHKVSKLSSTGTPNGKATNHNITTPSQNIWSNWNYRSKEILQRNAFAAVIGVFPPRVHQ